MDIGKKILQQSCQMTNNMGPTSWDPTDVASQLNLNNKQHNRYET